MGIECCDTTEMLPWRNSPCDINAQMAIEKVVELLYSCFIIVQNHH